MKTVHEPEMSVKYPEDIHDDYGARAAEEFFIRAFPEKWLHNLQNATLEATTVEELRQIVAELIYVLSRSIPSDVLKWPL